MTLCSRILSQWDINDLFNDATGMDGERNVLPSDLRLDGTLESMWIVSACHTYKKKLRPSQGDKKLCSGAQNAQQLRRDCALTSTSTLWINRPDSHKLKPKTRGCLQVKVRVQLHTIRRHS